MAVTITKIGMAWTAAVIAAGAATGAVAGCATSAAPRPVTTAAAKRDVTVKPAGISFSQGAKICTDLNAWVAGAWQQSEPRFGTAMESDENVAGYSDLGSDLMELDTNLVNLNSGALKNSRPDYYPVTGLGALTHDCAGYGVSIKEP
jgi:hypothetical protein